MQSGEGFSEDSSAIAAFFANAMRQPDQAGLLIDSAEAISGEGLLQRDVFLSGLSRYYVQTGRFAQAEELIDSTLRAYRQEHVAPLLSGKFHSMKAAVAAYQNRQEESVQEYETALRIFEAGADSRQAASVHFNLANIFFSRLDFQSAYDHISLAREMFVELGDSVHECLSNGILSVALSKLDSLSRGKEFAERALRQSAALGQPLARILAHYAAGEAELAEGRVEEAAAYHRRALELIDSFKIRNLELPVRAALLDAHVRLKQSAAALEVGRVALQMAQAINHLNIQYNLNRNLAFAYENQGDLTNSYAHLKDADSIFRNSIMENNHKAMQELLVQYETEKKNHTIFVKENQISRQKVYIGLLAAVAAAVLLALTIYYRYVGQRQRIAELQRAQAVRDALHAGEEKERKRLADELHDGIASSLVAIRMQLEQGGGAGTAQIVSRIKETHREVREIAHNLVPPDFEKSGLIIEARRFCRHFADAGQPVHFYANTESVVLPQQDALILYRSLQELVQNAVRHSGASSITVQVLNAAGELRISVEDTGRGMPEGSGALHGGTGLSGLRGRLAHIGAGLETDNSPGNGLSVFISYPLNSPS